MGRFFLFPIYKIKEICYILLWRQIMSLKEFDKILTEHDWKWSCWENVWRKDNQSITYTDTLDSAILYEKVGNEIVQTSHTFEELCKLLEIV